MKRIEAIIFDWAGTTVDYGCMAPIYAMQQAFSEAQVKITLDDIRKPMGMLKIDHIKAILAMDHVADNFKKTHGKNPDSLDIDKIYNQFEKNIFSILHTHTTLIDGVLAVQDYLRNANIKIGTTTGYTKDMLNIVATSAKAQGYHPDYLVASDQVLHGRPYPYMLQKNLAELNIRDVRSVIKVGDTIVDIQEGLHAGCWSIGVIKGSSMLGLNEKEIAAMSAEKLQQSMRQVKYAMFAAGADYVVDSIDELPLVIDVVQQKMNNQEFL